MTQRPLPVDAGKCQMAVDQTIDRDGITQNVLRYVYSIIALFTSEVNKRTG